MHIDRRRALGLLALGSAAPGVAFAAEPAQNQSVSFLHGVASGDPLQDRAVLWTRVTPVEGSAADLSVKWEIAEDEGFKHIAARGTFRTGPWRDYTVKVDAAGLKPGREYRYRFHMGKTISPIGRVKTLPDGHVEDVVLAFVTCSLYPNGYFNAYHHIAAQPRVDAVVELGDYIYEYGAGENDYGMENGRKLGRIPEPPHEMVTLADYRMRHALYKRDADLQAAHARCAWICVWDDHEVANDSWMGGAENHQPKTEGSWLTREAAALKAYYEWMPIREPEPGRAFEAINRSFRFGDLADLIMVETRLVARSYQLEHGRAGDIPMAVYQGNTPETRKRVTDAAVTAKVLADAAGGRKPEAPYVVGPDPEALKAIVSNPERQMLGVRQEQWLSQTIAASAEAGRPWQLLGNQVVMARTVAPNVLKTMGAAAVDKAIAALPERIRDKARAYVDLYTYDIPYDLDGWDGYPAARERAYDTIKAAAGNVIVFSGDSHAFWANELHDDSGTFVAAEFGTSSITSPQEEDYVPGIEFGRTFVEQNKEVVFCSQRDKGYILLTLTRAEARAAFVAVETLAKPYKAAALANFRVTPAPGFATSRIEKI